MGKLCKEIEEYLGKVCNACLNYSYSDGMCSENKHKVRCDETCPKYKQGDE